MVIKRQGSSRPDDTSIQGSQPVLPKWLRVEDAASIAGVSRAQLYGFVMDGQLPSIKIGRSRRIALEELTKWLQGRAGLANSDPSET